MAKTAKRYLTEGNLAVESRARYLVGIYSRISVDHEEKKSESIENQIMTINSYIARNNSNPEKATELIVYDTYIDRGKTGTNFEREGFVRMMDDVRNGLINCIIVKDFSRFARDYIETGNYIEKIFPFLGVRFISVNDNYDSIQDVATNMMMSMNIKNLVNDMYAKDISKKVLVTRRIAQKRGDYLAGMAPYGYIAKKNGSLHSFELDKEAASVVKFIFEQYGAGNSIKQIIDELYSMRVHRILDYQKVFHHVYAEDGEKLLQWGDSSVRSILRRVTYCGNTVQHRMESKFYLGEKGFQNVDEQNWIVKENTHDAIISEDTYQKVSERLIRERKKEKVSRKTENDNIFKQVVFCGHCGRHLQSRCYTSAANERKYQYYCEASRYEDSRKCVSQSISSDDLEEILKRTLHEFFLANNIKKKDISEISDQFLLEELKNFEKERCTIDKSVLKSAREALTAYTKYRNGVITHDAYMVAREKKYECERFAEQRIREIEKESNLLKRRIYIEKKFLRSLCQVERRKSLNCELVDNLVSKILVFSDGRIEVILQMKGGELIGR